MDYLSLGPTPAEEGCAQVGAPDYVERATRECRRYVDVPGLRFHLLASTRADMDRTYYEDRVGLGAEGIGSTLAGRRIPVHAPDCAPVVKMEE